MMRSPQADTPRTSSPASPDPAGAPVQGLPRAGQGQAVCPVLWVDMVDYGRADVSTQVSLRTALNDLLARALSPVPEDARVVLETECGLAVCFLSSASDAARVGRALFDATPAAGELAGCLRIGLNVGAVAVTVEHGEVTGLSGDGMRVAECLADFATAGQALGSVSFLAALRRADRRRSRWFSPDGTRSDAQLRTHEVFALRATGRNRPDVLHHILDRTPGGPWRRTTVAGAAALTSCLFLVGAVVMDRSHGPGAATARAGHVAATTVDAPASSVWSANRADRPSGAAGADRADPTHANAPLADTIPPRSGDVPGGTPGTPVNGQSHPGRTHADNAVIRLAISPWGEVIVNGSRVGVSPPLNAVEVPPGKVTIEIRNGPSATYERTLALGPGQRVRVKHKF
ncbi:MAG: hypothetical protein GC151_15560 [Betaproteobacteria bacterium]|nr:hypothetical protein [Betaproteobacteria bacterium]